MQALIKSVAMTKLFSEWKALGLWLLVISLAVVVLVLPTSHLNARLPGHHLVLDNALLLKHEEDQLRDSLLLLGALEGVYRTLQSSQVGVDFVVHTNITMGEVLAPVSREVVAASEWLSLGAIVNLSLQYANYIAPSLARISLLWFLCAVATLLGLKLVGRLVGTSLESNTMRWLATTAFYILLLFHLIIPYAIHGSQVIAHTLFDSLKTENYTNLKNLHDEVVVHHNTHSFAETAKHWVADLDVVGKRLHKKLDVIIRYRVMQILILQMNILLPIVFIGLYIWAIRCRFHLWLLRDYQLSGRAKSLSPPEGE